ncbi:DUF2130 domain-containing protein [uncultured Helicobacter sp.]|uniref:DUF2130 domain-containing protein n=1 Tax=uncultured Helicobacter sp. TaxID=175537 RepID=UPI00262BDA5A|nr:DUF2130 domain-containing protein [uncultured Helicobacter sp.]
MQEKAIKCPNCKTEINVQSVVYQQIYAQLQQEQQEKKEEFDKEVQEKRKEYQNAFNDLKEQQQSLQKTINDGIQRGLQQERIAMQESLKKEVLKEHESAIEAMQKELQEKSNKVKELYTAQSEIERLKRENNEMESKIKAQAEQDINIKIQNYKDEFSLKIKEKDKQLQDLQKQLQEAQRKADLGSQQLQGEVQELAIEEYLQRNFPLDSILEIKKGQSGGDCVQIVHTKEGQNCGKIYYESKRTKNFQKDWIEKLKSDMRSNGSDIGVLVTEALPKEFEQMGIMDGVWICTFSEFKALSLVLRDSLIKISLAKKTTENKQEKMQMLYSYLTSSEFKLQIEAIVEGFTQMQKDLDKEKNAMQRLWKQREKQIQKVLDGSINMYGALQGIAGNAISNIPALDLDYEKSDFIVED